MTKKLLWILASIVTLEFSLIGLVNPSYSFDQNATGRCVGIGIYQPFNWWRKTKLAAAYFVNPDLVDTAKVGKIYSMKAAAEMKILGKLESLAEPRFAVMVPTNTSGKLVAMGSYSNIETESVLASFLDSLPGDLTAETVHLPKNEGLSAWYKGLPVEYRNHDLFFVFLSANKAVQSMKKLGYFYEKGISVVAWNPKTEVDLCKFLEKIPSEAKDIEAK